MITRVLPIVLIGLLATQPAMTQAPRGGAGGQEQYRLTGVMVSESRRTALLNGRVVHEGMRIGGALVESIDQRQIRVRIGPEQQVVRVGHFFMAGPSEQPTSRLVVTTRSQPGASPAVSRPAASPASPYKRYTVADGDTLSGIALRHRPDGVTMDQMMVSLFDANPDAFLGNLNKLKAGASLRIPDDDALRRVEPALASAKVQEHHQRWRGDTTEPAVYVASAPDIEEPQIAPEQDDTVMPVKPGDTLSGLAHAISVSKPGISTAQVMVALYETNPHAFGATMNTLYEGAVLKLSVDSAYAARPAAAAHREVQRQVAAWGHDPPTDSADGQPAALATTASAGLPAAEDYLLWRWDPPH